MAPASLKKTIQAYKAVEQKLQGKLEQLRRKKEELDSRAFTVIEEGGRSPDREGQWLAEQDVYRTEVGSLVTKATDLVVETLELKLMYVRDALQKLSMFYGESPRSRVPPELAFSHYEEWLDTNQRLLELNMQLYDLEKLKFELRQKQVMVRSALKKGRKTSQDEHGNIDSGSRFIQSSVVRIQAFLSRYRFSGPATTTQVYLTELLNPHGSKVTLECQKVQEYIAECLQHAADVPEGDSSAELKVQGAHPQRYQQFMAVLCGYIVQKQRESQGEELSYEHVFSIVERQVMPKIKTAVLRYVCQRERDEQISLQCERLASITLDQLRVKPSLQSPELVPFIDSVTHLRASYFSSNPTDKMYAVVAAAKALYDQLGMLREMSIDGDSFLDLWVYVILKANIKDLATNIMFMSEYGNPQLANDEAGYYLTTLEAAARFIEDLSPQKLKVPDVPKHYLVCEGQRFSELSALPSSCFRVVTTGMKLEGYKVAVVVDWALNRARLFSTVLLPTGNPEDTATVTSVSLSPEASTYGHIKYFTQCFDHPGIDGLYSRGVGELGHAVLVDTGLCDLQKLVVLPSGDFDQHCSEVEHVIQLIRLGSQGREPESDSCVVPSPSTPTSSFVTAKEELSATTEGAVRRKNWSLSASFVKTPSGDGEVAISGDTRGLSNIARSPYLLDTTRHMPFEESYTMLDHLETRSVDVAPRKDTPLSGTASVDVTGGKLASKSSSQTITVEVEVHESEDLEPEQFPLSLATPKELLSLESGERHRAVTTGTATQLSPASRTEGVRDPSKSLPCLSPATLSPGEDQMHNGQNMESELSVSSYEDHCPSLSHIVCTSATASILSPTYVHQLERNFVENHLYGGTPDLPLAHSVKVTIQHGQLFLQRMNYLSVCHPIDGVYSDTVLDGVRRFQVSHNLFEARYSTTLPENGYLTNTTFQYLRQAFLTCYANMLRLDLDKEFGLNFDPLSIEDAAIHQFRECVEKFQRDSTLTEFQRGSLCPNTIDMMRTTIRRQRHTIS